MKARTFQTFYFIPFSASKEDFHRFTIFQPIKSHVGHLGCRAMSLEKFLEEDDPRSITSKFNILVQSNPEVKCKQLTEDVKWRKKLTCAFGSDELKHNTRHSLPVLIT